MCCQRIGDKLWAKERKWWEDGRGGSGSRKRRHKGKRKGRFFKAIKKIGKKVGKVAKKAVKAVVRFNPLSIAIRNGLLAALRINMFGISKKLQYAYLPDNLAAKYNIDKRKLADLKKRHKKVRTLARNAYTKYSLNHETKKKNNNK